jgi:uroporphyrinogen decarboxylase
VNERERFLQTIGFAHPDRIPLITGGPRESTLARWHQEGLPQGKNWLVHMCDELGIFYDFPKTPRVELGVDFRMIPQFEEKVLEHKNGHYIVQDWMGNVTEISDQYDYTYIRHAIDFVTRKWHRFPVETPADFEKMKERYDVDTPERYPDDITTRCRAAGGRDWVLRVIFAGPFWQMREWCGFEPLCMMFAEQPGLIEEMCSFWSDFVASMLERLCSRIVVDVVRVNEDMAYKGASMISPAMVRRFLLPVWSRWTAILRNAGVPVLEMDSDGRVDELIPIWVEGGFSMCSPVEVAAGCDINLYRERHDTRMAFAGGVDKRAIAKGGRFIEEEMSRIAPVVRSGGYIPGCDHGMPPDISWDCLLQFGRLWAQLTGWL